MAKISEILKKAFIFSSGHENPVLNSHDTSDVPNTPFENEVLAAFKANLKTSNIALLVTLKKDDKGYMSIFDPVEDRYVKCTHRFETVAEGKNPYLEIEEFDYNGQPVVMAFDLKSKTGVPLQYQDWLSGTISMPSKYIHKPVICLPPREHYDPRPSKTDIQAWVMQQRMPTITMPVNGRMIEFNW